MRYFPLVKAHVWIPKFFVYRKIFVVTFEWSEEFQRIGDQESLQFLYWCSHEGISSNPYFSYVSKFVITYIPRKTKIKWAYICQTENDENHFLFQFFLVFHPLMTYEIFTFCSALVSPLLD